MYVSYRVPLELTLTLDPGGTAYCTLTLSPILVFASYLGIANHEGTALNTTRMFTSLNLISLLASPLIHLFQALPALGAALACFQRMQTYLEMDERRDYRIIEGHSQLEVISPFLHNIELHRLPSLDEYQNAHDDTVVLIRGGGFGWSGSGKQILTGINLRVCRGEHVILVGPVGCGKSLLLKAILGEAEQLHGSTYLSTESMAFCSEIPWLENTTVKRAVAGFANIDDSWYSSVMHACALEDLQRLSERGESMVGSKGANLSGGQRQRLVSSCI